MDKYNIISPKNNIPALDEEMMKWLQLPTKMKFIANDDCMRLYGCTVTDYYNMLKVNLINMEDKAKAELSPSNITMEAVVEIAPEKRKLIDQIMINPYIVIIDPSEINTISDLNDVYADYLSLNAKNRRLSDYYSVEILGMNVRNTYEFLKSKLETEEYIDTKIDNGEEYSNIKIIANAESVASAIYDAYNKHQFEFESMDNISDIMEEFRNNNAINKDIARNLLKETGIYNFDKDKLYLPKYCPWFTLDEMKEMGFDGTIPTNMSNNDWRKAVIEAYNNYQEAPSTINENKVLELGWNPHVAPDVDSFGYSKIRQANFINYYYEVSSIYNIPENINEMTFEDLNYVIMQPLNNLDTDTLLVKKVCYDFKHNK